MSHQEAASASDEGRPALPEDTQPGPNDLGIGAVVASACTSRSVPHAEKLYLCAGPKSIGGCTQKGSAPISERYTSTYTPAMGMTTIKVPKKLRDRINLDAKERKISAAQVIEELLDARDRARRMAAFGRAFQAADEEYWVESKEWESASVESDLHGA